MESICYFLGYHIQKVNKNMYTFKHVDRLKIKSALRKLINGSYPESKKTSDE